MRNDMTRRDILKLGGLSAIGVGLAACGTEGATPTAALTDPPAGTPAPSGSADPNAALSELEAAAEAEGGQVLLYAGSEDYAELAQREFQAKYPWATVNLVISSAAAMAARLTTETQANAPTADLIVASIPISITLRNDNTLQAVTVPNDSEMGGMQSADRIFHPIYQNLYGHAYNTNLQTEPPPTDVFELADPSWRGKLAMPHWGASNALYLAAPRSRWGDTKWFEWLDGLKANDILITESISGAYQAVVQGERQVAPGNMSDVLSQEPGTPVEAGWFHDSFPYFISLNKTRLSANPNTADLLMHWFQTEEAQQGIGELGRIPTRPNVNSETTAENILPDGFEVGPVSAIQGFLDDPESHYDIFEEYWPS